MTKTLLENLMEMCEIELARNISLWTNETGMLAPDRVILGELCHEDCSMQGQCVNGKSTNQKSTKYMLIFFLPSNNSENNPYACTNVRLLKFQV